jgi:hypothetical protein
MTAKGKSRSERLKSAAIVKLKYQMLSGTMDQGFMTVYQGVLSDLGLTEDEVEKHIETHAEELKQACLEGSK